MDVPQYRSEPMEGYVEYRYYDSSILSNKFEVGETIEWGKFAGESREGYVHYFSYGTIKKITPWTVLIDVVRADGAIIETRFDKGELIHSNISFELKEAIEASVQEVLKTPIKGIQHLSEPHLHPDAKQCFRCGLHYPPAGFEKKLRNRAHIELLADVCIRCYKKTQEKINGHNSLARANGGKTGLQAWEWLLKLKASQGHCFYCKEHFGYADLIMEHQKPLSWSGDNLIDNVVPACQGCNSSKGDRDYETWQRHNQARKLETLLQEHFGLSRFELINLAIKRLAIQEGLLINENEAAL